VIQHVLEPHLTVEVLSDQQVLLGKASSHLLLLLQAAHQLKLLLGQVIYVLLQRCEVVGLGGKRAIGETVCQGDMRPQTNSMNNKACQFSVLMPKVWVAAMYRLGQLIEMQDQNRSFTVLLQRCEVALLGGMCAVLRLLAREDVWSA